MIIYFALLPAAMPVVFSAFQGSVINFGSIPQSPWGVGPRRALFIAAQGGFPASYWPDGNG